MAMMDEETKQEVKKILDSLENEVKIVFFKENINCPSCLPAEEFLKEISSLSQKLKLEIYNKYIDEEKTAQYSPAQLPAIFIETPFSQKRVVFYGIPAGYEFVSFLEAVKTSSSGKPELEQDTFEKLKTMSSKVNIKVFVTPTCPYCPAAVVLAQRMAVASENITAEMIESNEFPGLAAKYQVEGVPKIVINDKVHLVGAQPESSFVAAVIDSSKSG
ncbi:MAG: glutaredoxin [Elusimicrobia bacterium]|nr:glutaredoxin [Elusimicrobiota bacterium]